MAGSERRSRDRSAVTCPAAPRPARAGAPSAPANSARRAIASSAKPGSHRGPANAPAQRSTRRARAHTPFPVPGRDRGWGGLRYHQALPSSVTVKRSSPKSRKVAVAIRCRRRPSCQGSIGGRGRKRGPALERAVPGSVLSCRQRRRLDHPITQSKCDHCRHRRLGRILPAPCCCATVADIERRLTNKGRPKPGRLRISAAQWLSSGHNAPMPPVPTGAPLEALRGLLREHWRRCHTNAAKAAQSHPVVCA